MCAADHPSTVRESAHLARLSGVLFLWLTPDVCAAIGCHPRTPPRHPRPTTTRPRPVTGRGCRERAGVYCARAALTWVDLGAPTPATESPTKSAGTPLPGPSPSGSCSGETARVPSPAECGTMVSSDIFVRDTDGHTRPRTLPAWLEQLTGGQSRAPPTPSTIGSPRERGRADVKHQFRIGVSGRTSVRRVGRPTAQCRVRAVLSDLSPLGAR